MAHLGPEPDGRRPSRHNTSMQLPPTDAHDATEPCDIVENFSKMEDLLASVRGKTLTQTVFADIISSISIVKSSVIKYLSRATLQQTPATPVTTAITNPPIASSYANALKRVSTNATPTSNIRTAVLAEMKISAIEALEASSAERICANELLEQEKRQSHALIFSIPEQDNAFETFTSLLSTCAVTPPSDPPTITRLGSIKENKVRPVRIVFSCSSDANKLFNNLSSLRGNEWSGGTFQSGTI
jgi:hypothetical protein